MELPHVNMNGTARDELVSQYTGCVAALNIAIDMLCKASPHGRDYPMPFNLADAAHEHAARIKALCVVRDDMHIIAENIVSQSGR